MTNTIKSFVGKTVGFIRINKAETRHNNGFECAAWWQKEESALGVFPLVCVEDYYNKGTFYAVAKLPARVIDCDFTSYFGGVAISGTSSYSKTQIGRAAEIVVRVEFAEAIDRTGNSVNLDGRDIWLNRPFWDVVLAYHQAELERAYTDLPNWWNKYAAGDDEYSSRVGMVSHFGKKLADHGEKCRRIQFVMKNHDSNVHQDYAVKNRAWVPVELNQFASLSAESAEDRLAQVSLSELA